MCCLNVIDYALNIFVHLLLKAAIDATFFTFVSSVTFIFGNYDINSAVDKLHLLFTIRSSLVYKIIAKSTYMGIFGERPLF